MKYQELVNRYETLEKIGLLRLPRKASAAIARNLSRLQEEKKSYVLQRVDIANRYAQQDEKGNFVIDNGKYVFKDADDREAFLTELAELNEIDVDVSIAKFDVSELDKCDESDRYGILTPAQESAIAWMIDYGD